MDNVVQNISILDIIPSNYKPSIEEENKIQELTQIIRYNGLLEPILVRPKSGKYEIVTGNDKYLAAIKANLNVVPVIIKEIDNETFAKYSNINHHQTVSFNTQPIETFSKKEEKSDIVNLSELSKIKLEYERDDVKMNNGQFNNDMMNNNFNQPTMTNNDQAPTFGGRFFPSLEDEPTNMNMMGGLNVSPVTPEIPAMPNPGLNNNLIDLTDLTVEQEQVPVMNQEFNIPTPEVNIPAPEFNMPMNEPVVNEQFNQVQPNQFNIPNPMPMNENIISIENLHNNNPAVQPINEPVPMEVLNADFGPQMPTPEFNVPTPTMNYEMPNAINMVQPTDVNLVQNNEFNQQPQNFEFNGPVTNPGSEFLNTNPVPNFDYNQPQNFDYNPVPNFDVNVNNNYEIPAPTLNPEPMNMNPSKDITPVANTIKSLVTNLEAFGYKINVVEEDLMNSLKLTIEVEK